MNIDHKCWLPKSITASKAGIVFVSNIPSLISRMYVETPSITVQPYDADAPSWAAIVDSTEMDFSASPLIFNHGINLKFSGAGIAWILYQYMYKTKEMI